MSIFLFAVIPFWLHQSNPESLQQTIVNNYIFMMPQYWFELETLNVICTVQSIVPQLWFVTFWGITYFKSQTHNFPFPQYIASEQLFNQPLH